MRIKLIAFISSFLLLGPKLLCSVAPNTVVATINVGVTPAGLAITPDNKFAYVANNNNYGIPGGDTVSVLNLKNNLLETTISDKSFNEPYRITINPSGKKAYVANSNSTTVTIISTATNKVIGIINGFDGPSGMAITPDGTIGYVNNYGGPVGAGSGNGKTVSVVNLKTNKITQTITVDQAPAGLAITPNGKFVYVINYVDGNPGTGTISVIRTSDNKVVDTIKGFFGPFTIAITPNGKYAYVTNFGSNNFAPIGKTVSAVDLKSNTIIANIKLAIQPAGIAITPDSKLAYATNYNTLYAGAKFTNLTAGQGTVNIIDIKTNKVIPPIIAVGQSPDGVAISSNGEFAYVTNYTSNIVSVIALQTFEIVAQVTQVNCFVGQKYLANKITWTVSGTSLPISYSIYRDIQLTDLVGTVLATQPFVFFDTNINPNINYNYFIVGTNKVGTSSIPVHVTRN